VEQSCKWDFERLNLKYTFNELGFIYFTKVNECLMERLYAGKEIIYDLGGDKTPTESSLSSEAMEEPLDDETSKKLVPSSYEDVERLCREVWPVLAVIGGVDRGLRVGGKCCNKVTGKRGILLGATRVGSPNVKIQWDDDSQVGYVLSLLPAFGLAPSIS